MAEFIGDSSKRDGPPKLNLNRLAGKSAPSKTPPPKGASMQNEAATVKPAAAPAAATPPMPPKPAAGPLTPKMMPRAAAAAPATGMFSLPKSGATPTGDAATMTVATPPGMPMRPPTITINRPGMGTQSVPLAAPPLVKSVAPPAIKPAKSETAKVDLAAAAPAAPGEVRIAKPAIAPPDKRQTSRISIDSASPATPAAPKTIRIKRPGGAMPATSEMDDGAAPAIKPAAGEVRKGETSRIELPPDAGTPRPATRKKTVQIKRTVGAASGTPTLTISKTPSRFVEPTGEVYVEKGPGWPAMAATILALLVSGVLLYVQIAQFKPIIKQEDVPSMPFWGQLKYPLVRPVVAAPAPAAPMTEPEAAPEAAPATEGAATT